MKVSPGKVHELWNEGLSVTEIARRINISRALVNLKLREYELDACKRELDEEKADLEAREAKVEARGREINRILELEEKALSLKSEVQLLQSQKEIESFSLHHLSQEVIEKRSENAGLASEKKHLDEEVRVKKKALNEIEQSYYGFLELTKRIALYFFLSVIGYIITLFNFNGYGTYRSIRPAEA